MEGTLEPINPVEETPYGALIIGNDVLCTPTSLCTWSEGGDEPEIYCRQPAHTLNPVCQTVNTGIGLIDCYSEPTCGGMVRPDATEKILRKKPHYTDIIRTEEERQGRGRKPWPDYAWAVIIVLMVVLLMVFLGYGHKVRKRRLKRHRDRHHRPTQSRRR